MAEHTGGDRARDAPEMELDELLSQLVEGAQDAGAAQARLRGLLGATRSIIGDLDLPTVLSRVVASAVELSGAEYGALGVIAPDGNGLEQFVHEGMDPALAEQIGHLPQGKGLLGMLIEAPQVIRVDDLTQHERSVGFPDGHPPMRSFLGVPIRVRDEVFGNLYLTRHDDRGFDPEDEEVVLALAGNAGVAIENARLYAESRHREDWLEASAEVSRLLLANDNASLQLIAQNVRRLADGDLATLVLPEGDDQMHVVVADGAEAEAFEGSRYPVEGTLSDLVMRSGESVRVDDADDTTAYENRTIYLAGRFEAGPVMVLPLLGAQTVRGTLVVARTRERRPFSADDLEMATAFASHASIALELAEARAAQQRMVLMEDRARIARDLHDHVIQQLFAAGLSVQGVASTMAPGRQANSLERVVDSIDEAIKQIRTAIFQLRTSTRPGLRASIVGVVDELRPSLGFGPRLDFTGPLDSITDDDLAGDVVAVVREALTNVARHAGAQQASVHLRVTGSELMVAVADDGEGLPRGGRRSGLNNLRSRAEARGGELTLSSPARGGGTTLEWRVPVGAGVSPPPGG